MTFMMNFNPFISTEKRGFKTVPISLEMSQKNFYFWHDSKSTRKRLQWDDSRHRSNTLNWPNCWRGTFCFDTVKLPSLQLTYEKPLEWDKFCYSHVARYSCEIVLELEWRTMASAPHESIQKGKSETEIRKIKDKKFHLLHSVTQLDMSGEAVW